MNGSLTWYVDRASGLVALLLLTAVVVVGVVSAVRARSKRWPRFAIANLHRNLALLALAFGAVHVLMSVVDGYVNIRLADAFIPFASAYRPFWVGLGAITSDLMLALLLTSAVRRRLGYRAWRAVHWLAYACWATALVHTIGIGTDARAGWVVVLIAACVGAAGASIAWRVETASGPPAPRRREPRPHRAATPVG